MGKTVSFNRPDGKSVNGYLAEPAGGAKANGVPSDASSCVNVPPSSGPAASPSLSDWSAVGASSPIGSRRQSARANESAS